MEIQIHEMENLNILEIITYAKTNWDKGTRYIQLEQNFSATKFTWVTSDMEIAEPPIEETELPYLADNDCAIENGENWRSDSLLEVTFDDSSVLCNGVVYDCYQENNTSKKQIQGKISIIKPCIPVAVENEKNGIKEEKHNTNVKD